MALPQHILYGVGGTVALDPPVRGATAKVSVFTGDGDTVVAEQAAVIADGDGTLAAAAAAGAESLTLNSGHGIVDGDKVWLRSPSEQVRVRKVSGDVITLWAPTLYAHAISSVIETTRVSYALDATEAGSLWWDGWARFTLDSGEVYSVACCCTKYPIARTATAEDLRALVPFVADLFDAGDDVEALLDAAHEQVLLDIETRDRVHTFVGGHGFARAVAYHLLAAKHEPDASDAGTTLWERYTKQRKNAIEAAVASTPRDADQDGTPARSEAISTRSRRLVRR